LTDPVKSTRHYDSTGRQEHARRNRQAVLDAAHRQFLAHGYATTTLAAVAEEAGVSVETIYKAFANKAGLLKAVFDVAVAGDDDPVPVVERDWVRHIQDEPDPATKLRMFGVHVADVGHRTVPVQLLARDAAASDPAAAGVWERMVVEKLVGMGMFAAHLAHGGHLRLGVTADEARDVLALYLSPELYQLLVLRQRWSEERFGRWIGDALVAALLP
jgi:AcrR family transcriptional regulator